MHIMYVMSKPISGFWKGQVEFRFDSWAYSDMPGDGTLQRIKTSVEMLDNKVNTTNEKMEHSQHKIYNLF